MIELNHLQSVSEPCFPTYSCFCPASYCPAFLPCSFLMSIFISGLDLFLGPISMVITLTSLKKTMCSSHIASDPLNTNSFQLSPTLTPSTLTLPSWFIITGFILALERTRYKYQKAHHRLGGWQSFPGAQILPSFFLPLTQPSSFFPEAKTLHFLS